jgi:hypothetical protein
MPFAMCCSPKAASSEDVRCDVENVRVDRRFDRVSAGTNLHRAEDEVREIMAAVVIRVLSEAEAVYECGRINR